MNKEFKIIDLTHHLLPEVPTWDGGCSFNLYQTLDYGDCTPPNVFRKHEIKMQSGTGTHIDAPAHVIAGGRTVDELNLEELISDCVMIDVSADSDANYVIMPAAVEAFENKYGEIKPNSFVIFYTGWDKHWSNRDRYRNDHKFPGVDISTAELLLKRNVTGIGIDTLSADTGANGFPVHRAVLGADKYLVENIADAKYLPPIGAKIFVLPIKIQDATEAPVRLIAMI